MIKKYLLGLCVCVLGFIGFSSSFVLYNDMYVRENGTYGTSPYDFSYDVQVVNRGNLLTNSIGLTTRSLYFRRGTYFTWKYSDYLGGVAPFLSYTSSGSTVYDNVLHQGFPKYYALCDQFLEGYDVTIDMTGCVVRDLDSGSLVTIANFMSGLTINDSFAFNYRYRNVSNEQNNNGGLLVCFSSEYYGKSMCFGITRYTNSIEFVYPGFNACSTCPPLFSGYGVALPGSFENLYSRGDLSLSPGSQGGNIDGSSNEAENVSVTGNILRAPCSNGFIISRLESEYSYIENSCYAGVTYNPAVTVQDGSDHYIYDTVYKGTNFKDLYIATSGGLSWNKWYNSNMQDMFNRDIGNYGINPFVGKPVALYTYFYYSLYQYGNQEIFNSYDVLNYCKLKLFSNYSDPYKGDYFKKYCKVLSYGDGGGSGFGDYSTGVDGSIDDDEILPPGFEDDDSVSSSGVSLSVDWSGVLSGDTNKNFDGKNFINDFYQKLQSVYQKPLNSTTGIIPGYILVFLVAIILFRFISH